VPGGGRAARVRARTKLWEGGDAGCVGTPAVSGDAGCGGTPGVGGRQLCGGTPGVRGRQVWGVGERRVWGDLLEAEGGPAEELDLPGDKEAGADVRAHQTMPWLDEPAVMKQGLRDTGDAGRFT
jgi:hypothetical protein